MRPANILPALLLSAGLAHGAAAAPDADLPLRAPPAGANAAPVPATEVPVQLAQASDAAFRVQQLEEEVRQLNGRIEELNFLLLQMQEQMRKMQEDNEFRFQELEQSRNGKAGGGALAGKVPVAPGGKEGAAAPGKSQPSEQATGAQRSDGDQIARVLEGGQPLPAKGGVKTIDGVEIYQGTPGAPADPGLQPQTLGTLTFDEKGNVVDSQAEKPIDLTGGAAGAGKLPRDDTVASLELPNDPEQLYELGYNYIQAGEYALAEDAFEQFSEMYPDDPRIAEARFWVGESLLSRSLYEDAAKVFLDAHKRYPDSRMGPQMLVKLGVSLAGMNQRELACATFAEVAKQYPAASSAIRAKVAAEQNAASCK